MNNKEKSNIPKSNSSSSNESQSAQETETPRGSRPVLLTALSVLVAVFFFGAWQFQRALSDTVFHFDFALVNIITAACVFLLLLGWISWLWFNSGLPKLLSRVLPLALLGGLIGFPILFQPVFKGAMGIDRWEPRYWSWRNMGTAEAGGSANVEAATSRDFTQFLGNNRTGNFQLDDTKLNSPAELKQLWKVDVGKGWSGVATRGNYVFTMEQRGAEETVFCYDIETGQPVWSTSVERRHQEIMGAVGPRATPTLDGEFVYTNGANGIVQCLDIRTGKVVWRQDMTEVLGIQLKRSTNSKGLEIQLEDTKVMWGRAGSPLIVDDMVVVPGGGPIGDLQTSLIGFNKKDGKKVWESGTAGIGYSSPVVMTLAGIRQIVSVNENTVSGHNISDGVMLWSHKWLGNSDADANTSQPCYAGDSRVLVSKGYGIGAELIEVWKKPGGDLDTKTVWKSARVLKTKLTSAIVDGDYAYGLSDTILECVDLKTGDRVWKRGRYGHGQMLIVGDKLVVHHENGSLHFIEKSSEAFQETGEPLDTISGICWNYFAVTDRHIIVRSDLEMACYEIPGNGQ